MADTTASFAAWLAQAQLPAARLAPEQLALLHAVFRFRQQQGSDYYSLRLLSHFLLHCSCGLKVAVIARLLGLSRPTASRQQKLSSKEAIRQAHHRMDGRPYGKLLPRYAGPVAQFLFSHPDATRADLIDFIDTTFGVRVSRVALASFLKKFGLDEAARQPTPAVTVPLLPALASVPAVPTTTPTLPSALPVPRPAPPFSAHGRSTRALS
jgi:Winged helix-turn helix